MRGSGEEKAKLWAWERMPSWSMVATLGRLKVGEVWEAWRRMLVKAAAEEVQKVRRVKSMESTHLWALRPEVMVMDRDCTGSAGGKGLGAGGRWG